eukprot:scaffold24812_cov171-Cylindrotheca_fusiformis.AAC.2
MSSGRSSGGLLAMSSIRGHAGTETRDIVQSPVVVGLIDSTPIAQEYLARVPTFNHHKNGENQAHQMPCFSSRV